MDPHVSGANGADAGYVSNVEGGPPPEWGKLMIRLAPLAVVGGPPREWGSSELLCP